MTDPSDVELQQAAQPLPRSYRWMLKGAVQWALAHLPLGEQLNHVAQRLNGSFSPAAQRHSLLMQGGYLRRLNERFPLAGKTVVEIGPGWQGVGTLLLCLFDVRRNFAFDHQSHLRAEMLHSLIATASAYVADVAAACGLAESHVAELLGRFTCARNLEDLLDKMRITYCAPGDAASTKLPDGSIDLVYSYGVLEHIPVEALRDIFHETRRILSSGGRASHNIGLHDHFHGAGLGNGVNFLRYSERTWAFFCHNAILYHNRLRLPDYLELFQVAGLRLLWQDSELLEVNRTALRGLVVNPRFSGYNEDDLIASHLYVDLG